MKKLAIITTHPIQYYAPVFKLLHERKRVEVKVYYTWGEKVLKKYDPGFNKVIAWDIPLLEGYTYEWAKNIADDPGSHHFNGIVTPELITTLTAWQPDALLIYGWGYQSHLRVLRHFKNKIPVIFRGDSTLLDEKKGIKLVLKTIFLKWVYKHVDYALYVGSNNKAYFKEYGLKEKQLSFAPHAIDNSRFAAYDKDKAKLLRQTLGIRGNDILLVFAGKLEEKKAPFKLLEAFASLKNNNAHLLFVGNGHLEVSLKNKALNFFNVHFMDFQNQSSMPEIYGACDLFCLPSQGPGETWGLAVNEAMACEKAILASDKVGCAADLVKPGINGNIFKAGSETDLAIQINALISSGRESLHNMGLKSAEIIEQWSLGRQVNAIEILIEQNTGEIRIVKRNVG